MSSASEDPAWLMQTGPAAEVTLNGRPFLYFAGTGYLGLQSDPRVIEAAVEGVRRFGLHTATTRAGYGTSPPVAEVERRTAEFLSTDAAFYLVSGYATNDAVAAAISDEVDLVLVDKSAHDCLREATSRLARLTQPPIAFRHRDPGHVAELLERRLSPGHRALVMTDGVFAASGRLAPLSDYLAVLQRYAGAMLLVDDAHGVAVLGACGRGALELAGVPAARINSLDERNGAPRVFHTATLSKAIGGHGGAIVGSRSFVERVRSRSGWFRGSSAPAAPVAAATARALEIIAHEPELRARLAKNVRALRTKLTALGLAVEMSPSPIVSLELESTARMQQMQAGLVEAGIAIGFTQNYSGAPPRGMLRIAVFATHTPEMIDRLVDGLRQVL